MKFMLVVLLPMWKRNQEQFLVLLDFYRQLEPCQGVHHRYRRIVLPLLLIIYLRGNLL